MSGAPPRVPVAVAGACGRLGSRIVNVLGHDPKVRLTGALEVKGHPAVGRTHPECAEVVVTDHIEPALLGAKVVVEASLPGPSLEHCEWAAAHGMALLVAVTGLAEAQLKRLDELSAKVPVLVSANLSMGVSALAHLCREAARGLGFDVEIVETHHVAKRDAPSGTALMLARAVAESRGWGEDTFRNGRSGETGPRPEREIGIHALRCGEVIGEHRVVFAGPGERLELMHSAQSRDCFARGALPAALFLASQAPGRYTMDDVWKSSLRGR